MGGTGWITSTSIRTHEQTAMHTTPSCSSIEQSLFKRHPKCKQTESRNKLLPELYKRPVQTETEKELRRDRRGLIATKEKYEEEIDTIEDYLSINCSSNSSTATSNKRHTEQSREELSVDLLV